MSDGMSCELHLALEKSDDSDHAELDALARQLLERLLELDVECAKLDRSRRIPAGAKPGEAITLGALMVTAAPFVLRSVVQVLLTWLENRPIRAVTMTIDGNSLEVQNISSADQRRLIETFIAEHATAPPPEPEPEAGTADTGG
ncbi:hypothetical protein [Streptomyces asoensis]|uniref:hypothetical protein n=1 Tax=Streptomyces asoensis TaxID=249586 RepID=UPI0033E6AE78